MATKNKSGKKSNLLDELEKRRLQREADFYMAPLKKEPKGRPLPPDLTKEIFLKKLDTSMFPEIEKHMNVMPKVPAFNLTFKKLMDDLYIEHLDELEVIRTLFIWLIWQDYPSIKVANYPDNLKEDSPMGYFRDIVFEVKTFAQLFCRLGEEANLHTKEIKGFIKGTTWFPDYKFTDDTDPMHDSWNAVFIDGHWRFIDVRRALSPTAFEKSSKTEKIWEDFYFLPNPPELINTHFPDEKNWQLIPLNNIVKLEQFEASPKKWPAYFSFGMSLPSNVPGMIDVEYPGVAKIELTIPKEARKTETYKCELLTRDKMMKKLGDGTNLTRQILHYTQESKDIIQVFIPKKGEYILEIYGMSIVKGLNIFNIVAIYQLNCADAPGIPETDVKPQFPRICSYYGMSPLAVQQGIGIISPIDSIVKCNKYGEGKVRIYYTLQQEEGEEGKDKFIEFVQNLYEGDAQQDEPSRDRVLQCSCRKGTNVIEVTFMFRVTQEGNFALILYYNRNRNNPEYVDFAHFLGWSKKPVPPQPEEFPHIKQGKVGPVQPNCQNLGVKLAEVFPSDGNDPAEGWVATDEFGEAVLCFEHDQPLSFMAEKVDDTVETMIECTPNNSCITVRCIPKEDRKTFIFRVYAAKMGQTENIPQVYQFMFMVVKPGKRSVPLPKCPSYYWGGVQNKLMEHDTTIHSFSNSASWTQQKFRIKTNPITNMVPCRLYTGGEDIELELTYGSPFAIKPMLKLMDQERRDTTDYDKYCISQSADLETAVIRMRFPKKGNYVLALFSAPLGTDPDKQQLAPFYYCLIMVEDESANLRPFPSTFAMWSSSSHSLKMGLDSGFFKRGQDCTFKLEMRAFLPDGGAICGYKEYPYLEVMLLIDEKKVITSAPGAPGHYKWTYKPTDDNKVVNVAIIPKPGSDEVLFALQYKVIS